METFLKQVYNAVLEKSLFVFSNKITDDGKEYSFKLAST